MNLHGLVAGAISAVNPNFPVTVQISVGQAATAADGKRAPAYATPGSFTGSISGSLLTVSSVAAGVVQVGQTVAGSGVTPGTVVTGMGTGTGGLGTYLVNQPQEVAEEAMTAALTLLAQIQPMTWRDLQQTDGLNLQGTRYKIYLFGQIDGVVRPEKKGGDLVTVPAGNRHAGVYLIAQVLEQFPDWCSAAATLQNT